MIYLILGMIGLHMLLALACLVKNVDINMPNKEWLISSFQDFGSLVIVGWLSLGSITLLGIGLCKIFI